MTTHPVITINDQKIGLEHPPYVVAELSGNHIGDYDRAVKIIEEAAKAGVSAVKLQTYTADTLSMDIQRREFMLDTDSPWAGKTQYELYQSAYTPWEWHKSLFEKGRELNVTVFSSPFDETAVDFLEELGAPAYKIASYELIHIPLIKRAAKTGKPLILSTGLGSLEEITEAIDAARKAGGEQIILLHAIAGYPTPIAEASLVNLRILQKEFPGLVYGISDHSPGAIAPIASIGLGARLIEKHITLDRADGGPDADFSLEPAEMTEVVSGTHLAWQALGNINAETLVRPHSEKANNVSRRSIFVSRDMKAGEEFTAQNIKVIRPHYGLKPKYFDEVIGQKAAKDLDRGHPLAWNDVEGKAEQEKAAS